MMMVMMIVMMMMIMTKTMMLMMAMMTLVVVMMMMMIMLTRFPSGKCPKKWRKGIFTTERNDHLFVHTTKNCPENNEIAF